jgi:glycosyltransferase involved in cell wall biosynthesis
MERNGVSQGTSEVMPKDPAVSAKERAKRVAMVSSVHRWNDTRICVRESSSLGLEGYDVILIAVGDRKSPFEAFGVRVHPLPRRKRSLRWINWLSIIRIVFAERVSVVHAHDPELFPLVLLLRFTGCKVVCDVHENVPEQILHKEWIPQAFRGALSKIIKSAQKLLPRLADAVILAEDSYEKNFPPLKNVSIIRNFPLLPSSSKRDYHSEVFRMIYVGDVRFVRGIAEYVAITGQLAKQGVPVQLRIVGSFANPQEELQIRATVQKLGLAHRVQLLGRRPPEEIPELIEECDLGLALLHPIGNYRESYPTKMFEYMAAGLPVIASQFALWESILVKSECGRCVDPLNIDEASKSAAEYWYSRELRELHGRNGRKAVVERYHWDLERRRLVAVYAALTQSTAN